MFHGRCSQVAERKGGVINANRGCCGEARVVGRTGKTGRSQDKTDAGHGKAAEGNKCGLLPDKEGRRVTEGWRSPVGLEEKQQGKCNRQTPVKAGWRSWPSSVGSGSFWKCGLSHTPDPKGGAAAHHPTGACPPPATEFNPVARSSLANSSAEILEAGLCKCHAQLRSPGGTGHAPTDSKVIQVSTSINVSVSIDLCAVSSHQITAIRDHAGAFGSIVPGLRSGSGRRRCRRRPREG